MNTLYSKFQRLKANFVMFCSQNALKSLEKRSNFVLEKSVKPQSDFCTNPLPTLLRRLIVQPRWH